MGAKTAAKLHSHGIETVADVAELGESTLSAMVGEAMGRQLYALAHNVDRRRVNPEVRRRSVGAQRALGRAGNRMSPAEVDAVVVNLVDRVTGRMRAAGRTGRTVTLRLRFDDFSRVTRSRTLPHPTAATVEVLATARLLVVSAAPLVASRGLTLIGLAVSGIDRDGVRQLELPFGSPADPVALDAAVDRVRSRYGAGALTPAVLLGHDPGPEVPHLPD